MRRPHLNGLPYSPDIFPRYETASAIATEMNAAIDASRTDPEHPWPVGTNFTDFGGFTGWWSYLAECAAVFESFQVSDDDWIEAIGEFTSRVWDETIHLRGPLSCTQLTLVMGLVVEAVSIRSGHRSDRSSKPIRRISVQFR
jgi:hypothetical protein